MGKHKKEVIFALVLIGVILLSLSAVSAFSFGDWLRELFGANKITGYDILEGRLASYSFDSAVGTNVVIASDGVGGKSGNFSGNGYVSMALSEFPAYLSSGNTTNYIYNISFSVWFKTSGKGVILGQQDSSGYSRVPALYIGTDGKLYASFFWHGYGGATGYNQLDSSSVVNDNQWHHAVVTYAAIGQEVLYIDNTLARSQTGVNEVGYAVAYYYLGRGIAANWPNSGAGSSTAPVYYSGLLDEVAVYNRALTASEVSTIYNEQKAKISSSGGGGTPTLICLDSDGQDYYTRGNVTMSWSNGTYIQIYYDIKCLFDGIIEYYCDGSNLKNETYICPYGCGNGICLRPSTTACTDTDGGVNYYVNGTASYRSINYSDYCLDSTTLLEYSCDVDGKYTYQSYGCQNGCDKAICNRQTQPPPPIPISELPQQPPLSEALPGETPAITTDICNGCVLEDKCVPIGFRQESKYCSAESEFVSQLGKSASCDNNFECSTNLCIDNECIGSGLWQKFLSWLKRLF